MNVNFISPAIFYLLILICIISLHRNGGFKIIYSNFETLKYYVGTAFFFLININVLFFCSFCEHCHGACISFTLSSVTIGLVVYLIHLGKQTISAIKHIVESEEFDPMAPFVSIPYFVFITEIFNAIRDTGLQSLHTYESKMLIVLLYPFFVTIGELIYKIKKLKENTENKI